MLRVWRRTSTLMRIERQSKELVGFSIECKQVTSEQRITRPLELMLCEAEGMGDAGIAVEADAPVIGSQHQKEIELPLMLAHGCDRTVGQDSAGYPSERVLHLA